MGVNQIARFALAFVMLPILVHRLGADRTGLYFFAVTLTGYFTAVEYSLATSLTKYIAEFRATGDAMELNSFLRGTLLLMVGIGVLVAAVLAFVGLFGATSLFGEHSIRSQAEPTILVAAATALVYWPTRVGPAALQGVERYDVSAVISLASSVLSLGGIVLLTQWTLSVPVFVAFFGAVLVAQNIASGVAAWPHLDVRRQFGRWRGAHLRSIFSFGGALFVIGISDTLVYSFDRTIIAGFVGAAAIVIYEVAVRLQSAVRTVSALAGGALISTASRLIAQGRQERLRELVLIGSFLGVMITTPVAVLLMVLAAPTIDVWVGHDYVRYADYAQIFISIWLVSSNTGVLGSAITGTGRLGLFAVIAIAGSVVSLALSVGLTAAYGVAGVIWGTWIPSVIGLPIWMYFVLRRLDLPIRQYVRYVIIPGYTLIAVWSGLVLAMNALLSPSSFVELAVFTTLALAVFWAFAFPMARLRWRRALRGGLVVARQA